MTSDFTECQRQAREHDTWFRAEVEQGLREADDPGVQRIAHEDAKVSWRRRRAELMKKAAD